MTLRSLIAMSLFGATLVLGGPVGARPLQLADYLGWKTAGGAQISPDGKRVIYGERRVVPEKDTTDTLTYIMNADGSGRKFLLDGSLPRWSPQGDRLAYSASAGGKRFVFVRDMTRDDAQSVAITNGDLYPSQIAWSPDGAWIAFAADVPAPTTDFAINLPRPPDGAKWGPDSDVIDTLDYRGITGELNHTDTHIFVISSHGGAARDITPGDFSIGAQLSGIGWGRGFEWSADGRSILFDGLTVPDSFVTSRFSNVLRVDVASGRIEPLTHTRGFWIAPRASPDGRRIVYFGNGDDPSSWPRRELHVMDSDGGNDRVLISDLPDEPGAMHWAPDGSGLFFAMNDHGRTNLRFVSLAGVQRDVTRGAWRLSVTSFSDNGLVVATVETPSEAGDIVRIELSNGDVRQITDVNTVLKGVDLATTEEITTRSADGTPIQGWLMKPPGFDPTRKYPLILDIHGGPHEMAGAGFDFRYQEFAARGYLVLWSNPRGSTGYGHAFANAIDGAFPGDKDFADLTAVVDDATRRGFTDPSRLYVMGCSGGGALTEWVIAHTDRFAAATVMCPVSDWMSLAGTSDAAAWAETRFRKPFWEDPTPWLEHSPIMHVGSVRTPTLVMIGDEDYRTPRGQAEEYYAALKVLDVPTKLIIVKGESHQPWHAEVSNLFRTQLYIEKWFGVYSKGDPKP